MNRFVVREHVASILVAALSSTFGVALLLVTDDLSTYLNSTNAGNHAAVQAVLRLVAFVFISIALYTAAVVTSNTFATIIAGRTRTIALLRLIGATARSQRRAVAREGLVVGVLGAVIGLAVGLIVNVLVLAISMATGFLPALHFTYFSFVEVLPAVAVVLTTWLASWVGSRRVLVVSPIQATGAAEERPVAVVAGRRARNVWAAILFVFGGGLLLAGVGVGVGQSDPKGLLISVVGGMLSFTGVVLGADAVMPRALQLIGRTFGRSAPARLAAQNAVRYPERSSRTTIGIVIGVTLVTMFSVAVQTFLVLAQAIRTSDPESYQSSAQILTVLAVIFSVISGFSALLAAIGLVNNLSLSVLQRIRELGLLRALGFTGRQIRTMIVAESAQLTITAVVVGLLLGTFYGWAGAEAMIGGARGAPGIIWPALPPVLFVVIVVVAALLTWVASVAPTRRATRVTPVDALAVE
jgi:putative ABC transport system permease protein